MHHGHKLTTKGWTFQMAVHLTKPAEILTAIPRTCASQGSIVDVKPNSVSNGCFQATRHDLGHGLAGLHAFTDYGAEQESHHICGKSWQGSEHAENYVRCKRQRATNGWTVLSTRACLLPFQELGCHARERWTRTLDSALA